MSAWPLPHIDDILATLGEARVFTSLDLRSGYFQIPLDDDAKEKCTFTSHRGLFSFNVLPFGLTSAPSLFTSLMTQVLDGINGKFAAAYLDDIVIYSRNPPEHLLHLREVFLRLRKFDLKLKRKKCEFMEAQIVYLGFIVSKDGIKVDPEKVSAIQDMRPPKGSARVYWNSQLVSAVLSKFLRNSGAPNSINQET